LPEILQRICDQTESFLPRDGLPSPLASFAHSFQRGSNAIRIVETLKTCNAFGTERPSIDRMERIPNDVDCPSIDHSDQYSTTPHALTADSRHPSFNARGIQVLNNGKLRPLPKTTA
jgi:hypothetical protein